MTNLFASMRRSRLDESGFTLIEVMMAVAILAVLAAIAIPNYSQYVVRSKLTDAANTLADVRVKMEQHYQDNRNYGSTGTNCGFTMPVSQYFSITCETSNSAQNYTVTASSRTGKGLGAASAYTYTIDHLNNKATTSFKGVSQSGKSCWLISGSEC